MTEIDEPEWLAAAKSCVSKLLVSDTDFASCVRNLNEVSHSPFAVALADFQLHPDLQLDEDRLGVVSARDNLPEAAPLRQRRTYIVFQAIAEESKQIKKCRLTGAIR